MLEKPDLPDEKILSCLRDRYGIAANSIAFMPTGNDSNSWVYRVGTDDGETYFLKAKKGSIYEPSVAVPHYLKDNGIEQVVAPLPTRLQELWQRLDQFALLLYPFIDGNNGMAAGMSNSQWIEYGAVVKAIHSDGIAAALAGQVPGETFQPVWSGGVSKLQAQIDAGDGGDPLAQELARFWRVKRAEIRRIVDRAKELGRMLRDKPPAFVLCHADIHTANVMIDNAGRLYIVDWDQPVLAPRERDLMFVVESRVALAVKTREEELFFRGYGNIDIDWLALAYYRYEWAVQEIGDYAARVFLTPDAGEVTRKDAVQSFQGLFQPGHDIESAYQSEANLH
jgi:spectinomycin phosphotransferase